MNPEAYAVVEGAPTPPPPALARAFFPRRPRLDPAAPVVDNIARVIGAGPATRLFAAFGGHRLYIPQRPAPGDPIAALVGHPAALQLGAIFGGERVWLPNGAGRESRRRIAALRGRGAAIPAIARELGCSERYVYKVLRQLREDAGQVKAAPAAAGRRPGDARAPQPRPGNHGSWRRDG